MPTLMSETIEVIKMRALNLVPSGLNLQKEFFNKLRINDLTHIVFAHLTGLKGSESVLIHASENNAIKVADSGSGFTAYTTDSTTPPASFSSSAEIEVTDKFHRVDILVESQDVEIRFLLSDGTWGNAIPIKVGNASIDFSSTKIQWKYRSTSGASIHVTAWS